MAIRDTQDGLFFELTGGGRIRDTQDALIFELGPPIPVITNVSPNHGPTLGGTHVTITGFFFNGTTNVQFGGEEATNVVIVSNLQITCDTPAHAVGLVDVSVTTPSGTGILANGFEYVDETPTVTSVVPNFGSTSGNQAVQINGTFFVADETSVVFGGVSIEAENVTVISDTALLCATPAHAAGLVDVSVTTPYGTGSLSDAFMYVEQEQVVGILTADRNGCVWMGAGNTLYQMESVTSANLYPQFAESGGGTNTAAFTPQAMYDITTMVSAIGKITALGYDYFPNVIVIMGEAGTGTFNISTGEQGWIVGSPGMPLGFVNSIGDVILDTHRVSTGPISIPNATPVVRDYDYSNWVPNATTAGEFSWDATTNSLWVSSNGGAIYRLYLDRLAGAGIDVAEVIAWLCGQSLLKADQYDTSQILGLYFVSGVQFGHEPIHSSLAKLMEVFLIDAVDRDGKIIFLPRNRPPYFMLSEDDLGALESVSKTEARMEEVLTIETDVPHQISISYYDLARNYNTAIQYEKRISEPYGTNGVGYPYATHSKTEKVVSVPISSDATTMKRQAQIMLYEAWAARFSYAFKTMIKFAMLDPADIVIVDYKGTQFQMRIVGVDRGAGFALQFTAVSHDHEVYSSNAVSQPGGSLPADSGYIPPMSY